MGWGSVAMICVAFFLLYLAIRHKFEPLLLLTIAFGMLLTNLPGANLYHTELFAGRACPLGYFRGERRTAGLPLPGRETGHLPLPDLSWAWAP